MLQEHSHSDGKLAIRCAEAAVTIQMLNRATATWHVEAAPLDPHDILLQLHRANFDIWHLEDRARDRESGDGEIATVKRQIDTLNQLRNDLVERIDASLLRHLQKDSLPNPLAPLHSETPGQMLDRLSILSLKLFHTGEESAREDASEHHRQRNHGRLAVLHEQQNDLATCLEELWRQVIAGSRRFKMYLQHKMYNDPTLNPVLYRSQAK